SQSADVSVPVQSGSAAPQPQSQPSCEEKNAAEQVHAAGMAMQGWPAVGHVKPGSVAQCCVQPSPSTAFPSSHCSPASTVPLGAPPAHWTAVQVLVSLPVS